MLKLILFDKTLDVGKGLKIDSKNMTIKKATDQRTMLIDIN